MDIQYVIELWYMYIDAAAAAHMYVSIKSRKSFSVSLYDSSVT